MFTLRNAATPATAPVEREANDLAFPPWRLNAMRTLPASPRRGGVAASAQFVRIALGAMLLCNPSAPAHQPPADQRDGGGILLPGSPSGTNPALAPTRAGPGNMVPAKPPGAAIAMDAFTRVRAMLNAGTVTQPPESPAAPPAAPLRVEGVLVEVRLGETVLARAEVFSELDQSDSDTTLSRATDLVIRQAARAVSIDPDNRAKVALLLQTLTLSVEIAGPLTPIEIDTGSDLDAILSPGVMGIALSVPGSVPRGMFPTRMLTQESRAPQAMLSLVPSVTGDPTSALLEPRTLRLERKVTIHLFRTLHVCQSRADQPGTFLHRGQRLIDQRDLDSRDDLINFVTRAGTWLDNHARPAPGAPLTEALTALALVRASTVVPASARWADDAIARLVQRVPTREVSRTPSLAAIVRVALQEYAATRVPAKAQAANASPSNAPPSLTPEQESLRTALALACDTSLNDATRGDASALLTGPRPQSASVAWARRMLAANADDITRADDLTATIMSGVPPAQLVSAMPWLGWADLRRPVPSPALSEMIDTLWEYQVTANDTDEADADFVGGIVFTRSKNPLPNWHAARPLAYVAAALRTEGAIPAERRPRELVRLLSALRFFRQLQIDDSAAWRGVPASELGGVRTAPWEIRASDEATAMTLLCLVETIRSLDAMTAPAAQAPTKPPSTTPTPPIPTPSPADRRLRPQDR